MFCSNCGRENADGSGFCAFCGAPLVAASNMAPQQSYDNNQNYNYGNTDYNAMNNQNYNYGNADYNAMNNPNYNYGNADYNAMNNQNYDYGNRDYNADNNQKYVDQSQPFSYDPSLSQYYPLYASPSDDINQNTTSVHQKSKIPVIIACASVLLVAIIVAIILIVVYGDGSSSDGIYSGQMYGDNNSASSSGNASRGSVTNGYEPLTYDEIIEKAQNQQIMAFRIDDLYYIPHDMDNLEKFHFDELNLTVVGNNDYGNRLKLDFSKGDAIVEFSPYEATDVYQVYEITDSREIFPCRFYSDSNDDYARAAKFDYNGIVMPDIPISQITEINGQPYDSVLQDWDSTAVIGMYMSILEYNNSQTISFSGYNGSQYETIELEPDDYRTLLYMNINRNRSKYADRNYFIYENRRVRTKDGYNILMDKDNNAPDNSGTFMFDGYMIEINL